MSDQDPRIGTRNDPGHATVTEESKAPNEAEIQRAADVAYATWYPQTDPKFTGKERAWKGDPALNPMIPVVKAALAALEA